MGLKDWIVGRLRAGLRTKRGRKAAVDLMRNEKVQGAAKEAMKSEWVRKAAREVVDSDLARDLAKETARDFIDDAAEKVKAEAAKLTEPLRELQERRAAERAERERREAVAQQEQEIDDELAALKRKLGKS